MLRIFNSKEMPFYIQNFSLPFIIKKEHIPLFLKKKEDEDTSFKRMYVQMEENRTSNRNLRPPRINTNFTNRTRRRLNFNNISTTIDRNDKIQL